MTWYKIGQTLWNFDAITHIIHKDAGAAEATYVYIRDKVVAAFYGEQAGLAYEHVLMETDALPFPATPGHANE